MYTLGIDIGSSSSKAVLLKNGSEIIAEDAIQAGTGRFLDVMSRVLETELSEMGEWHFRSAHPAKVSSTCTVFAESEVISLLSQGIAKEDIL